MSDSERSGCGRLPMAWVILLGAIGDATEIHYCSGHRYPIIRRMARRNKKRDKSIFGICDEAVHGLSCDPC